MTCSICPLSARKGRVPADWSRTSDPLGHQPAQHRLHAGHDVVQVDDPRGEDLPARKGQELPGEFRGLAAGLQDLLELLGFGPGLVPLGQEELGVAVDHREQVVEVVGDAPGQATQALHFLRFAELALEGPARGVVKEEASDLSQPPVVALEALQVGDHRNHPAIGAHELDLLVLEPQAGGEQGHDAKQFLALDEQAPQVEAQGVVDRREAEDPGKRPVAVDDSAPGSGHKVAGDAVFGKIAGTAAPRT